MILDALLGGLLQLAAGLIGALPEAAAGPTLPLDVTGFSQVLGTMMLLDEGLPVHETIAAVAAFVSVAVVVDLFIVVRSFARWLPSWLTGGG